MFYGLASGAVKTGDLVFEHELQGIQELNERAMRAELEVTAVSIHAYAYLADRYVLLPHGASMGEGYGPRLVSREPLDRETIRGEVIAVPGVDGVVGILLRHEDPFPGVLTGVYFVVFP